MNTRGPGARTDGRSPTSSKLPNIRATASAGSSAPSTSDQRICPVSEHHSPVIDPSRSMLWTQDDGEDCRRSGGSPCRRRVASDRDTSARVTSARVASARVTSGRMASARSEYGGLGKWRMLMVENVSDAHDKKCEFVELEHASRSIGESTLVCSLPMQSTTARTLLLAVVIAGCGQGGTAASSVDDSDAPPTHGATSPPGFGAGSSSPSESTEPVADGCAHVVGANMEREGDDTYTASVTVSSADTGDDK